MKVLIGRPAVIEIPDAPVEVGSLRMGVGDDVEHAVDSARSTIERRAQTSPDEVAQALLDLLWTEAA